MLGGFTGWVCTICGAIVICDFTVRCNFHERIQRVEDALSKVNVG